MKKIYFIYLLFFLFTTSAIQAQNCTVNAGVPIAYCPGEQMNLYGNVTGSAQMQTITWSQISGPAVTIGNTHSLVTTCGTATAGATYVFRIAATCQDGITTTNAVTYTVGTAPPATSAGSTINAGCKLWGSSIALNATPAPVGYIGTWSIVSGGSGTFDNANSPTANFTPVQTGVANPGWSCPATSNSYVLKWSLLPSGASLCPNASSSANVTVNVAMYNPVDARAVIPGCGNATNDVQLYGTCRGTGTSTWTLISGPAGYTFASNTNQNVTLTNPPVGTYTFRYTVTAGCVSGSKDVTFTLSGLNYAVTSANANAGGVPIGLCSGTTYPATIQLSANLPNVGETGTWTQVGGSTTVTFSDIHSNTATVSGLTQAGAPYTFRWTITNSIGCNSFNDIVFRFVGAINVGEINIPTSCSPAIAFFSPLFGCPTITTIQIQALSSFPINNGWYMSGFYLDQKPTANPFSTGIFYPNYALTLGSNGGHFSFASTNIGSPCPDGMLIAFLPNLIPVYMGVQVNLESRYAIPGTYRGRIVVKSSDCSDAVYFVPFSFELGITTSLSNAGTDQNIPCGASSANLAGNNPLLTPPNLGVGKWSQNSGPNTAAIADVYNRSTGISGLIPGTYSFKWLIDGGTGTCNSAQDDVLIRVSNTPPGDVTAGANKAVCFGTPITLTADLVPSGNLASMLNTSGSIGTWSLVSQTPAGAAPVIVSPSAISTSVTGLLASTVYVFRYTASNLCGSKMADVTITTGATQGPSQANAGVNTCLAAGTTTVNLSATAPTSGTGTWSMLNAGDPGTITSPGNNITTVTGVTPNGIYGYVYTVSTGGCADTKDTVYISNQGTAVTTPNAGADQNICASPSSNTFTLTGNTPTNGTGHWEQVIGPAAALFNPNTATTVVTAAVEGTYRFKWVISNGVCTNLSDEVIINIFYRPDPAIVTTADATLCPSTNGVISINAQPITSGTGVWSIISGGGTIASASSPSTTATLNPGTNTLRWNVNAANGVCPSSYDEVIVKYYPAANAKADKSFCRATAAVLTGSHSGTGTAGSWSMVSQPGGSPAVTITQQGADSVVSVSPLVAGAYTFRYTVNTGGVCPTTTDDMVLTIDDVTDPSAGSDLCGVSGTTINLAGSAIPVGATAAWTRFSAPAGAPAGTFTNATTANATYTITPQSSFTPGTYNFQYQFTKGACQVNDYVVVRVLSKPAAGTDIKVCNQSPGNFTLAGTAPTGVAESGLWTIYNGGSPTITTPTANNSGVTGINVGDSVNFIWTISAPGGSGTCTTTDTVAIVNRTQQTASASASSTYCDNVTGLALNGSNPGNGTGSWSVVSQPAGSPAVQWTNQNSQNATAKGLTIGSYTFRYTISQTPCAASTSNVTVNSTCFVLPIKFEYFNARKEGVGVVKLDWKSSDAGEVLEYRIERSQDGSNWQQVGQVNAGMLDIYGYTDNIGTLSGTLYYRIRAINQDGSSKYTEIRLVRVGDSGGKLSIYPTITGGMINVVSSMGLLQRVRVSDGSGRTIIDRVLTGTQSVQLDISNYAKGIYYVEAITAEERKVEKVLRN